MCFTDPSPGLSVRMTIRPRRTFEQTDSHQSNRFQISWNEKVFAILLNGEGVVHVRVARLDEGLAPPQVLTRGFGRARQGSSSPRAATNRCYMRADSAEHVDPAWCLPSRAQHNDAMLACVLT